MNSLIHWQIVFACCNCWSSSLDWTSSGLDAAPGDLVVAYVGLMIRSPSQSISQPVNQYDEDAASFHDLVGWHK
jgi:hypothetical protein